MTKSTPNPIRVLIVDDHKVVRRGLKAFLMSYRDLRLVGEAETGEEAIDLCHTAHPDVVLMDLMLPGISGAEATRQIRAVMPDTQVIALTSFPEEELVEEALQAGAVSYLLKNIDADDLAAAIRAASVGEPTLAPEAAKVLIRSVGRSTEPVYHLTPREVDVLALLVQGLTNPEIAQRLAIKTSTVRFHIGNIFVKLGVGTRTEAASLALKQKLIL